MCFVYVFSEQPSYIIKTSTHSSASCNSIPYHTYKYVSRTKYLYWCSQESTIHKKSIHKKNVNWKKGLLWTTQSSLNAPWIVNLQSISIVFRILCWQLFAHGTAVSRLCRIVEYWKNPRSKWICSGKIFDRPKAFDCLPLNYVYFKLREYGLSPSAIDLAQSMYRECDSV